MQTSEKIFDSTTRKNETKPIKIIWFGDFYSMKVPANIYLFKVNNRNTRKTCEIWSKLTKKKLEQRHWRLVLLWWLWTGKCLLEFQAALWLVQSNSENTRIMCEITKTPEFLVSLFLTLKRFHTLFWCFRYWLWVIIYWLKQT